VALATGCVAILALGTAEAILATGRSSPGSASMLASAGAGAGASASGTARAARGRTHGSHFGELGQVCKPKYCPIPPLIFFEGKVQRNPALYVTFWGSNWNKKGAVLRNQILKMYNDFSGSNYQGILTQYFDSGGHISKTITVTSFTDEKVPAPETVTVEALEKEVATAITANTWPKEANGQYIIIPAPESRYKLTFSADNGCAYHDVTAGVSYSFVPFDGDEPFNKAETCNAKGDANAETMATASHEYGESATDPFFTEKSAWATAKNEHEITDICDSGIDQLPDGSWVQGQWDNFKNECALSDPEPAFVYAITAPAKSITGVAATLQGKVNSENMETKYWFEYGTSPTTLKEKTAEQVVGASWEVKPINQAIAGLKEKTSYYYVLTGTNSKGTAKGRQQKFETL
jgi:hypothetical protein